MRAEFFKPDTPDQIVGIARWEGNGARIEAEGGARLLLNKIFRRTPISVEDPALQSPGASGPVVLTPGSLRWFMTTARIRSLEEGLAVRLVPEGGAAMGWDPAGAYRTFGEAIERMER